MQDEGSRVIYEAGLRFGNVPAPDAAAELAKLKRRRRMRMRARISAAAAVVGVIFLLPLVFEGGSAENMAGRRAASVYIVDNYGNKVFVDDTVSTIENAVRTGERSMIYKQLAEPVSLLHSLNIPKGSQCYSLTLSDGTKLKVNSGSRITYPASFATEGERVVLVEYGEVFFEVAHDAARPFIVDTPVGEARVLGTKFNVQAFEAARCNVTLLEGSVKVKRTDEGWGDGMEIMPGENAALTPARITVSRVDVQNYAAWIDGYYYYDRKSVMEILENICDRYDYRIEGNTAEGGDVVRFWFDRNEDMASVVERLGKVANVRMVMKENRIILK